LRVTPACFGRWVVDWAQAGVPATRCRMRVCCGCCAARDWPFCRRVAPLWTTASTALRLKRAKTSRPTYRKGLRLVSAPLDTIRLLAVRGAAVLCEAWILLHFGAVTPQLGWPCLCWLRTAIPTTLTMSRMAIHMERRWMTAAQGLRCWWHCRLVTAHYQASLSRAELSATSANPNQPFTSLFLTVCCATLPKRRLSRLLAPWIRGWSWSASSLCSRVRRDCPSTSCASSV
ncbi:hypothetical protein IWW47_004522, partial [Coemansia sp. RSA 2052]